MLNHINIMGRLVAEPDLKVTNTGVKVASFRIASDRDFADANGTRATDFVDCVAWRGTAEFLARNFHKGQPILVSGRLQVRDYTDREGNNRRTVEIVADNLYFAGGSRPAAPAAPAGFTDLDDDGELPFDMNDDELPL